MKFYGIYFLEEGGLVKPATLNLTPGHVVYGEKLVYKDDEELRLWNPKRSKLSAAILNGIDKIPIKRDSKVLYLGAASGTTASHVSDIVSGGMVYCVEFSQRPFRDLLKTSEKRSNMIPILADARRPESYMTLVERCDLIYQDISQVLQAKILIDNAEIFLKEGGHIMIAIKARSIDSAKNPEAVTTAEIEKLKKRFKLSQVIRLEPYEKDHSFAIGRLK